MDGNSICVGQSRSSLRNVKLSQGMTVGRTYKALIFCQQDSDTGVDLADCERDEHCVVGDCGGYVMFTGY